MTTQEYLRKYDKTKPQQEHPLKPALEQALENRRFEIELYWKRSTYFWTISTVILGGYVSIAKDTCNSIPCNSAFSSSPIAGLAPTLIAWIGLILAVSWYLANKGSKFWMENWENQVAILSEEVIGPIYSTILHRSSIGVDGNKCSYVCSLISPQKPSPVSVSKINHYVSAFFILVWGMIITNDTGRHIWSLCKWMFADQMQRKVECFLSQGQPLLVGFVSLVYLLWLISHCKTTIKNHIPAATILKTRIRTTK